MQVLKQQATTRSNLATLDELFGDYEKERLAEIAKDEARRNSPQAVAKRLAEIQREIQQGLRDVDGNWIFSLEDPEPED